MSNIIKTENSTLIFSGGNPLKDCPTDWKKAEEWIIKVNEGELYDAGIKWSWDCGFKLDYDGPIGIVGISSRFYPPKTHQGDSWDGTVSVYLCDKKIKEKKFDCETLEELKIQVEGYVASIYIKLKSIIRNGL